MKKVKRAGKKHFDDTQKPRGEAIGVVKRRPKKSLGQNFLRDQNVVRKISEQAALIAVETILEIGPGEGVLTEALLNKLPQKVRLIAIEKDERLAASLKEKFSEEIATGRLTIEAGDILEHLRQKPKIVSVDKYAVVANIPYYITGAILRGFLERGDKPIAMLLMVQNEVADRIVAKDKKESLLSVSVKAYGKPRKLFKVPAGAFYPSPKIDSAVILIENISGEKFKSSGVREREFFEIVRKGFAGKRKMLRTKISLPEESKGSGYGEMRAENLTTDDWFKICQRD